MSEKPLKIVPAPEAKTAPADAPAAEKAGRFVQLGRKNLRMILLIGLPALAVLIGLVLYLSGGRYISTDNAYVGAQKVLITPDISGKVIHVALEQAKAKLDTARSDFDKARSNLTSLTTLVDLAGKNVELKQRDVDRKSKPVSYTHLRA